MYFIHAHLQRPLKFELLEIPRPRNKQFNLKEMLLYSAFQISLLDVILRYLFYTDVYRRLKMLICVRHVKLLQLKTKNFCITIPKSPI
jgi:hypothetical protein